MRILLLSRNRVVQELVKLAVREMEGVELEIAEEPEALREDRYQALLADDRFDDPSMLEALDHLMIERKVLLGEYSPLHPKERYDVRVAKPFLPREIRQALQGESPKTRVLDEEEIWQIRELLDEAEERQEAPAESEGGFFPLSAEKEQATTHSPMEMSPEELLELLEHLGTKKVRKLLKGARISIEIHWPEEE